MPVDPQLQSLLSMLSSAPPLRHGSIQQARAGMRLVCVDLRPPESKAPVRAVEDTTYPAAEGPRRARVYRPDVDGPVPTVLYAHGGGYVMGDVDTHDDHARMVCHEVGAVVVSVDYRLAPEHPFPAGHLDVAAALRHVVATVDDLGGDRDRIGVAGDSAGANLVGGAAVVARDEGLPLKAQLLFYPSTDFHESQRPSRLEWGEGHLLTVDDMLWFREQYRAVPDDPRASLLLHPDLAGVAAAVVVTAECDPLRDEGEAYGEALRAAGVEVRVRRAAGLCHGFVGFAHVHEPSARAAREACVDLKELLG